ICVENVLSRSRLLDIEQEPSDLSYMSEHSRTIVRNDGYMLHSLIAALQPFSNILSRKQTNFFRPRNLRARKDYCND
ncbi:MAG: hypothetical protein ABIV13_04915, partial [Fimbriimonadales bacterium]